MVQETVDGIVDPFPLIPFTQLKRHIQASGTVTHHARQEPLKIISNLMLVVIIANDVFTILFQPDMQVRVLYLINNVTTSWPKKTNSQGLQ